MNGYTLNDFFNQINTGDYAILTLNLQSNGSQVASLQQELQNYKDNNQLDELIEQKVTTPHKKRRWARFNIMILSFLKYCRDLDPWSLSSSCDLIMDFYTNLTNCLLDESYNLEPLLPLFLEQTELIIPMGRKLDESYMELGTRENQFLSYLSSVISKLFNSIKPSHSDDVNQNKPMKISGKQKILLFLVNKLNNLYFRINSPQLCSNIFKNFPLKSSTKQFSQFNFKEQLEYRFLLGKYYMINGRVSDAWTQFNTSFAQLILIGQTNRQSDQWSRNVQRVLRFLVPLGIVAGKCPQFDGRYAEYLQRLKINYPELIQAVTTGNMFAVHGWLQRNESLLRRDHLLLLLLEKLPIVVFRFLIKRLLTNVIDVEQGNRIPYSLVLRGLQYSVRIEASDADPVTIYNGIHHPDTVESAENVLVTLINLGFLRANCFPQMKLCVFQKNTPVKEVMPRVDQRISL